MTSILGELPSSTGVPHPPPGATPNPGWLSLEKKRVIPNHLAPKKKPGFKILDVSASKTKTHSSKARDRSASVASGHDARNASTSTPNNELYNIVSFGNLLRRLLDKPVYDETHSETMIADDAPLIYGDQDLPPTRLLHDFNTDVLPSFFKQTSADSFAAKDPTHFKNIFTARDDAVQSKHSPSADSKHPINHDLAVLVFGYPESLSGLVIQHFREFGQVLEDFETHRTGAQTLSSIASKKASGIVPILCGELWVKITYKTLESAMDALQENGSVFNGALLGVVPYSKDRVEKLEKRKLLATEDIGGLKIPVDSGDGLNGLTSQPAMQSFFSKLDIKDGSNLFLNADGDNEKSAQSEKLGVWATLSRYVFGFHEL